MTPETPSPPSLAIVILNFRTPAMTLECLESLAPEIPAGSGVKVILLDNDSGDNSAETIKAHAEAQGWLDSWLDFRVSANNLGFAGGNNIIMRELLASEQSPEFILLLNSDTIVHQHCLERALRSLRENPQAGAMSCLLLNTDGSVQNTCRRFPRPDRETARALGLPWLFPRLFRWAAFEDSGWDPRSSKRHVEWIGGAFMLLRTEALRECGVFDDRFYFLGEDCELCLRLARNGWKILYDPAGSIIHHGGSSLPSFNDRIGEREKMIWRTRFLTQRVCYGPWAERLLYYSQLTMLSLRLFYMRLAGKSGSPKARLVTSEIAMVRSLFRKEKSLSP